MTDTNWEQDLDQFLNQKRLDEWDEKKQSYPTAIGISSFFDDIVEPAFEALKANFEKHDREINYHVSDQEQLATMVIWHKSIQEFNYKITVEGSSTVKVEFVGRDGRKGSVVLMGDEVGDNKIATVSKRDIIDSVIQCYKQSDD